MAFIRLFTVILFFCFGIYFNEKLSMDSFLQLLVGVVLLLILGLAIFLSKYRRPISQDLLYLLDSLRGSHFFVLVALLIAMLTLILVFTSPGVVNIFTIVIFSLVSVVYFLVGVAAFQRGLLSNEQLAGKLIILVIGGMFAGVVLNQVWGQIYWGESGISQQAGMHLHQAVSVLINVSLSLLSVFPIVFGLEAWRSYWREKRATVDSLFLSPMFFSLLFLTIMTILLPLVYFHFGGQPIYSFTTDKIEVMHSVLILGSAVSIIPTSIAGIAASFYGYGARKFLIANVFAGTISIPVVLALVMYSWQPSFCLGNQAVIFELLGQYSLALKNYDRAIELDAENIDAVKFRKRLVGEIDQYRKNNLLP